MGRKNRRRSSSSRRVNQRSNRVRENNRVRRTNRVRNKIKRRPRKVRSKNKLKGGALPEGVTINDFLNKLNEDLEGKMKKADDKKLIEYLYRYLPHGTKAFAGLDDKDFAEFTESILVIIDEWEAGAGIVESTLRKRVEQIAVHNYFTQINEHVKKYDSSPSSPMEPPYHYLIWDIATGLKSLGNTMGAPPDLLPTNPEISPTAAPFIGFAEKILEQLGAWESTHKHDLSLHDGGHTTIYEMVFRAIKDLNDTTNPGWYIERYNIHRRNHLPQQAHKLALADEDDL